MRRRIVATATLLGVLPFDALARQQAGAGQEEEGIGFTPPGTTLTTFAPVSFGDPGSLDFGTSLSTTGGGLKTSTHGSSSSASQKQSTHHGMTSSSPSSASSTQNTHHGTTSTTTMAHSTSQPGGSWKPKPKLKPKAQGPGNSTNQSATNGTNGTSVISNTTNHTSGVYESFFKLLDTNGDGEISLEEFLAGKGNLAGSEALEKATCAGVKCSDSGLVHKVNSSEWMCTAMPCGPEEVQRCCAAAASCAAFECPVGTRPKQLKRKLSEKQPDEVKEAASVAKPTANKTSKTALNVTAKANKTYASDLANKTEASDSANKTEASDSANKTEASNSANKTEASDSANKTEASDPLVPLCEFDVCVPSDAERCCQEATMCSDKACGDGYALKANSSEYFCVGTECKAEDDQDSCCDPLARCSTMVCPDGFTNRPNSSDGIELLCENPKCTFLDMEKCCIKLAPCATLPNCPGDDLFKRDDTSLLCSGKECDASEGSVDIKTCCGTKAPCKSLVCPNGTYSLQDSSENVTLYCNKGKCDPEEDIPICCGELAECGTFECPSDMEPVAKGNNENLLYCKRDVCEDSDASTCCIALAAAGAGGSGVLGIIGLVLVALVAACLAIAGLAYVAQMDPSKFSSGSGSGAGSAYARTQTSPEDAAASEARGTQPRPPSAADAVGGGLGVEGADGSGAGARPGSGGGAGGPAPGGPAGGFPGARFQRTGMPDGGT